MFHMDASFPVTIIMKMVFKKNTREIFTANFFHDKMSYSLNQILYMNVFKSEEEIIYS